MSSDGFFYIENQSFKPLVGICVMEYLVSGMYAQNEKTYNGVHAIPL